MKQKKAAVSVGFKLLKQHLAKTDARRESVFICFNLACKRKLSNKKKPL